MLKPLLSGKDSSEKERFKEITRSKSTQEFWKTKESMKNSKTRRNAFQGYEADLWYFLEFCRAECES